MFYNFNFMIFFGYFYRFLYYLQHLFYRGVTYLGNDVIYGPLSTIHHRLENIHPRWFLFGFIGCILFIYFYIKIRYPFWNTQPVYHSYDFWRKWTSSPFIIQKNFPMKTKFCNFENIQTHDYLDLQDSQMEPLVDLLISHYIPSDQVLFTVTKKHMNEYFTGQNHSSLFSIYYEKQYNYGEQTEEQKEKQLVYTNVPIGVMTSRSISIFVLCKTGYTKYPCYFWDYLCVKRELKPKKLSRNIIQTHEYNQRIKNPGVLISLFKKEGELSHGIVPIVKYTSYTFQIPTMKFDKLPEHCFMSQVDKTNFGDFIDFLYTFLKNSQIFKFAAIPDIGSLKKMIDSSNMYVYLLKKQKHVLGMYVFKDAKVQYENDDGSAIQCIGSILNCTNIRLFYLGFLHSLQMITWKTHYKIVLFENIAHNCYIWEFFRIMNKEIMEQNNAYYLYNFVVPGSPYLAKDCLVLL